MRNLKALGLAAVAVLAFSAVAASAASAQQGKLTSDGPVTLTGEDTGVNFFKAFGSEVRCPDSKYTGHTVLTIKQTEEKNTRTAGKRSHRSHSNPTLSADTNTTGSNS